MTERKEAIRILDEVIPPPEHHTVDLDHLRIAQAWLCIKETLTAEPKHGRWIDKEDPYGFFDHIPVCSECGCTTKMREKYPYCPHCGARMDEVKNGKRREDG